MDAAGSPLASPQGVDEARVHDPVQETVELTAAAADAFVGAVAADRLDDPQDRFLRQVLTVRVLKSGVGAQSADEKMTGALVTAEQLRAGGAVAALLEQDDERFVGELPQ